jgi:DNA-binding phage protein
VTLCGVDIGHKGYCNCLIAVSMPRKRHKSIPKPRTICKLIHDMVPYIEASHISLTTLAAQAGMSRFTLYRWLRGEGRPGAVEIESMAEVLGLRITVEPIE